MITRRSALALFSGGLAGGALTRLTALPNRPVKSGRLLLRARSRAGDARIRREDPTLRAKP